MSLLGSEIEMIAGGPTWQLWFVWSQGEMVTHLMRSNWTSDNLAMVSYQEKKLVNVEMSYA